MRKNPLVRKLGGGLAIAVVGLCVGAIFSPTPVQARYCEHNLCDNGWLWSSCYASNVSTNCTMYGTWPQEFCYHSDCVPNPGE